MRIAMISETYVPYVNGVVTHIRLLKRALEAMGHDVLVVTVSAEKDLALRDGVLHCPSFRVDRIYDYRATNPFDKKRFEALRAFKPDIIHIHNEYTLGIFGARAARQLDVPLIYSIHMDFTAYLKKIPGLLALFKRPLLAYLNYFLKRADVILSMSHKAQVYMDRAGSHKKMELLPNSVEVSRFACDPEYGEKRRKTRQQLAIGENTRAFVFVGRLSREKNLDRLIDAFLSLDRSPQEALLFVVGDGPSLEPLRRRLEVMGEWERVTFLGNIDNRAIADTLFGMDYYLSASLSEMHSMSMLEAMASGLYCLVLEDRLNRWQIESGVTGSIWQNESQLKAEVERLLKEDDGARRTRREQVKAWSLSHDERHQVETLLAYYERAISDRGVSRSVLQAHS